MSAFVVSVRYYGKLQTFTFPLYSDEEIWYHLYRSAGKSHMCMMDEIAAKRDGIHAIAKKHKAEKLWVFGSCARKEGAV